MQITFVRPSAPEVNALLASVHGIVLAGTGHRPEKLGGYAEPERQPADILKFQGTFLSNFAPAEVQIFGETYPTVEHAYQAAKTTNDSERYAIQHCKTPGEAKKLGRTLTLRPQWDEIKDEVMQTLLEQKFQIPQYRAQLVATGTARLVEGNTWGDRYWGMVDGAGQNKLGLIITAIRTRLQRESFEIQDPEEVLVDLAVEYLNRVKPALVITGMALGWDTALALACVKLNIPYMAALPFPKQASRWPEQSQKRWRFLLSKAKLVVAVGSDELADADIKAAMQWRNEFMVDNAQLILACYDGTPGGTQNCVKDAQEQGKTIVNTYLRWQKITGNIPAPAPSPVRKDGMAITYKNEDIMVFPVKDSPFFVGDYSGGAVLIRKDLLTQFR